VGFTPWLARPENLKLLSETIGIELECEAEEKEVGPFRADILCKDMATDSWVLIENQLERTDHTHLGQLITYAAGLEAVTIVWISQRFTDEHRAALDWLNEKTDQGINFFGLEVELWRIGESPVAPKFNVVSKPNEWTRTVREGATPELTEAKRIQLNFWMAYENLLHEKGFPCSKPKPQSWINHSIGMTGARLSSLASMWNSITNSFSIPEIGVQLVLDGNAAKDVFAALEARKEEIETEIGFPLTWSCPTESRVCRVYARKDAEIRNPKLWAEQHNWLLATLEKFYRVFRPIVKELGESLTAAKNYAA
jgi:hypothetical protein